MTDGVDWVFDPRSDLAESAIADAKQQAERGDPQGEEALRRITKSGLPHADKAREALRELGFEA